MREQQPLLAPPPEDTFWRCVANLAKVIIGAGMMAIPHAYFRIGSCAGTCMLVLVAVMTYTTLVFLLRGSAATGATTYSQLARVTCGTPVMKTLQVAVLCFCFGFCVVYLVICRDILIGTPPDCNGLLCEILGVPTTSVLADARVVIVTLALLVCSPLLLLRTMDRLALLNVVGVAAIGMLSLTALSLAGRGLSHGSAHAIPVWPQWDKLGRSTAEQLQALTAVLPVMIACYVAHQSLHPLVPLLQPYSDARIRGVVAAALLIAFGVFTSLAVGSGLAFGPELEVNLLSNFSVTGLQPLTGLLVARSLSWSIRGGYLISLIASLLLYMHPLRACLAEVLWPDKTLAAAEPSGDGQQDVATQGFVAQDRVAGFGSSLPGSLEGFGADNTIKPQGAAGVAGWSVGRLSELAGAGQQQQQPPTQLQGSAFAAPAAQAAAAARLNSSGAGSASSSDLLSSSSSSRQLSTFDSFDNPRTGSWSGVRYMAQQGRSSPAGLAGLLLQQQHGGSSSSGSGGGGNTSGSRNSSSGPGGSGAAVAAGATQQPGYATQAHMHTRDGIQIHVSDARTLPPPGGVGGGLGQQQHYHQQQQQQMQVVSTWQQQEQRWYYVLTYGLLAAMVLVAIAVPNIWTALSAIGDLASTLQAFVVPGLIGIILCRKTKLGSGTSIYARLRHVSSYGTAVFAVILGLALFANGIYQRL